MTTQTESAQTLAGLLGIDGNGLEGLYAVARNDYSAGRYARAVVAFELLCLYEHSSFDYWLALGRCRQMMEDHYSAGLALSVAAECSTGAPSVELLLDVVECMVLAEDLSVARKFLNLVSTQHPDYISGRLKLLTLSINNLIGSDGGADE